MRTADKIYCHKLLEEVQVLQVTSPLATVFANNKTNLQLRLFITGPPDISLYRARQTVSNNALYKKVHQAMTTL